MLDVSANDMSGMSREAADEATHAVCRLISTNRHLHALQVQVNSRTHAPQKPTRLMSL